MPSGPLTPQVLRRAGQGAAQRSTGRLGGAHRGGGQGKHAVSGVRRRRLAYDGRGNAVVRRPEDAADAAQSLGGFEHGLYAEQWAPYVKVPSPPPPPPSPFHARTHPHTATQRSPCLQPSARVLIALLSLPCASQQPQCVAASGKGR